MKLWIARSLDNSLLLCTEKMSFNKQFKEWGSYYGSFLRLPKEGFPEVTFENSPKEIELKLVNNTTNGFAEDLLTNCKPLEGEFSKIVDNNFDSLI